MNPLTGGLAEPRLLHHGVGLVAVGGVDLGVSGHGPPQGGDVAGARVFAQPDQGVIRPVQIKVIRGRHEFERAESVENGDRAPALGQLRSSDPGELQGDRHVGSIAG
jgi:hypothetical protein